MENAAFTAKIFGLVQGVGFRYFTSREAAALCVCGYVKNLPDRTVEAHAEGNRQTLEQFLKALHKGPLGSQVDNIDIEWQSPTNRYSDFRITY